MRAKPDRASSLPPRIRLPRRSEVVNLLEPSGGRLPARVAERGVDTLLLAPIVPLDSPTYERLEGMVLEFFNPQNRVRVRGAVTVEDSHLLRFSALHSFEVLQQREYVRVRAARPVLVYWGSTPINSYSVDISGGGVLLAASDTLEIGEEVQFRLTVTPGSVPIAGVGEVVRSDRRGRRAISFDSIGEGDRRRLIRFIFECQRTELRRISEAEDGYGN